MKMRNNLATNQATMDCEEVLPRTRSTLLTYASTLLTYAISLISSRTFNKGENSPTRQKVPEKDQSRVESQSSLLLNLSAEIRNIIYCMVLDDIPNYPPWYHHAPSGRFCLNEPALAKVNRQLRNEMLPMFYYHKRSFAMRIYPNCHSDETWNRFLDRFAALTVCRDGPSFLSYTQSLQVDLCHPTLNVSHCPHERSISQRHGCKGNTEDKFKPPCSMCRDIYRFFKYGGSHRRSSHWLRAGGDDTNWTDRHAVATALVDSIRENARGLHAHQVRHLREMYPLDRLVDLLMRIAAECKDAAKVIHFDVHFGLQYYLPGRGGVPDIGIQ